MTDHKALIERLRGKSEKWRQVVDPPADTPMSRLLAEAADALESLTESRRTRRLSEAPCDQCGYNGPGYYQPATHSCATAHHAATTSDKLGDRA